ncbi:MAG: hypothetical protein GC199_01470 [Alphaproteobacteria bacterium]|nr:hypothetical protein [Alphaproteobacteria bacterium]
MGFAARIAAIALLGLTLAAGWSATARANEDEIQRKAMSATLFVFFHEFGHALISELDLPAVGREEDVVDEFATYVLLQMAKGDEGLNQVLADAVESWRLSHIRSQKAGGQAPFWDEHGLDLQRYFNIVCLMVGSDPKRWNGLRLDSGLPQDRAERCVEEYEKKARAWERLIDPYVLPQGVNGSSNRGKLSVTYEMPDDATAKALQAQMQNAQFYETIASILNNVFNLPHDVEIAPRQCGITNAFWDPIDRSIVMCYELVADFQTLYGGSARVARTTGPPASPPGQNAQTFTLVGHWVGETKDPWGNRLPLDVTFSDDGTFRRTLTLDGVEIAAWGKFESGKDVLRLSVTGVDPRNVCGSNGCRAVTVKGLTLPYRIVDADSMETAGGSLRRVSH